MHHAFLFLLTHLLPFSLNAAPLHDEHQGNLDINSKAPSFEVVVRNETSDHIRTSPALVKRVPGDQKDPKQVTVDCIGRNIEWVCNVDCFAILCAGKPQILQRDGAHRRSRYRASGAARVPFAHDAAWRNSHGGLTLAEPDYVSAEEFPFEGAAQGGADAILVGAPLDMQHRQGPALVYAFNHAYPSAVQQLEWYKLNFNSQSRYCLALAANDRSICRKRLREDDPKDFAFTKVQKSRPIRYKKWKLTSGISGRDAHEVEKREDETISVAGSDGDGTTGPDSRIATGPGGLNLTGLGGLNLTESGLLNLTGDRLFNLTGAGGLNLTTPSGPNLTGASDLNLTTAGVDLSGSDDPPGLKGLIGPLIDLTMNSDEDVGYFDQPASDFYTQEELGSDVETGVETIATA